MQTQINELRKKLVLKSASRYFGEFGYEKTQIDKIAKELSIGVGTIYSLFGSKEGLFIEWMFSILEKAHKEVKTAIDVQDDLVGKIRIFIEYKLNYYEKNKATLVDYMQNNQFFLKNTARRKENPMMKAYTMMAKIIEEFCAQNDIEQRDYLVLAYTLDGIVNAYIERFSLENIDLSTKTDEVLRIFLNSLGACHV